MDKLYRVIRKTTGSYQPGGETYWSREVLYCGYDRQEARRVYHTHEPSDSQYTSYGNPCTMTLVQIIEDSGTNDFNNDSVQSAEGGLG